MVEPVGTRPPQGAFLYGGGAEKSQSKLEDPAGFEASVREIAMVAPRDGEHAEEKKAEAKHDGCCCDAGDENQKAGELNSDVETGCENLRDVEATLGILCRRRSILMHHAYPHVSRKISQNVCTESETGMWAAVKVW